MRGAATCGRSNRTPPAANLLSVTSGATAWARGDQGRPDFDANRPKFGWDRPVFGPTSSEKRKDRISGPRLAKGCGAKVGSHISPKVGRNRPPMLTKYGWTSARHGSRPAWVDVDACSMPRKRWIEDESGTLIEKCSVHHIAGHASAMTISFRCPLSGVHLVVGFGTGLHPHACARTLRRCDGELLLEAPCPMQVPKSRSTSSKRRGPRARQQRFRPPRLGCRRPCRCGARIGTP